MCTCLKKIPAKFHQDLIWNDGALGLFEGVPQQKRRTTTSWVAIWDHFWPKIIGKWELRGKLSELLSENIAGKATVRLAGAWVGLSSCRLLPLLALCYLVSLLVSTPLQIVNCCWSGFPCKWRYINVETFNLWLDNLGLLWKWYVCLCAVSYQADVITSLLLDSSPVMMQHSDSSSSSCHGELFYATFKSTITECLINVAGDAVKQLTSNDVVTVQRGHVIGSVIISILDVMGHDVQLRHKYIVTYFSRFT